MESKLSKNRFGNDFIDRISDLPDSVLGQILSYLPVKNAVATSILSTRWKTLFPSEVRFTKLDLNDLHILTQTNLQSSSRNFVDFVDKLFNVTLRDEHSVEKIFLNCENDYGDDKILSWVCASLRLNVEHLRLTSYLYDKEGFFDRLNGCKTLVELELGSGFHLYFPGDFILPNLKRLSLYSLVFRDDVDSIHELIDGCPMLNDLNLAGCNFELLDTLYIQHPFINKLFIDGCGDQEECRVEIDAPNLEAFAYSGPSIAKYIVKDFKSFHSVCINFDYCGMVTEREEFKYNGRRLAKLVNACSSTTRLSLPGNSVMALYRSSIPLLTFQNLTCLEIGRMGSCGWRMLARFLKSAPNLAILTFQEELEFNRVYAGFKSSLARLPVCLERCLKKIEIWVFQGWRDEIKLMEYFLKNGRVLQELVIHCLPYENTSQLEELSMFPRLSKTCQVLFREEDNLGKSRYARDNWF